MKSVAAAALLASAAIPVQASDAVSAASRQSAQPWTSDIIVVGQRLFSDVVPERSLDEGEIEGYGVSTIDELLSTIEGELGDGDQPPLIIVDGQRVSDPDEIGNLPVEALRNLQVMPRGSAVRAGGRSGQRVLSLSLRKSLRTVTVLAAPRIATEGDGESVRGEAIYTSIRGKTRANLSFRARNEGSLLESDRDIIQREAAFPYAVGGNVIAYPDLSAEIDPLLSEAGGHVITVAPVPSEATPTLGDFASGPATATDLGLFRTLRPETRTYELNGMFRTPLAPWLTGSANLRLSRSTSDSMRGLPAGLFLLPDEHLASPFSRDVQLAYYGSSPLEHRSRRDNGEGGVTLGAAFGAWTGDLSAKHSRTSNLSRNQRPSALGLVTVEDSRNPFAGPVDSLISITANRAEARTNISRIQSRLSGPAAELPAGRVQATLEAQLVWNRISSESTFSFPYKRNVSRSEQGIRGALDIPLTSRANNFMPQIGDLSATLELGRIHFSDAGSIGDYAAGLTWEPVGPLRLRAAIEGTGRPAPIELLGGPVIITPEARVFDTLTGGTVDVIQITGGDSGLKAEQVTTRRLIGLLRLVRARRLNLNAEYTDISRRNFVSSLPEASAPVMLAFPERFIRDGAGNLTTVDLRPVNFEEAEEKRFRWGLSMNTALVPAPPPPTPRRGGVKAGPGLRPHATVLQLTANHTIVLSEEIKIRTGLDPIDLLRGGAIGMGGGRVRYQIDGTVGVTSGGSGVRLGVNWRGRSELQTLFEGESDTLRFSPLMKLNLRAFTDVHRFMPGGRWAKGLRLSVDVVNLTNDRQEVRNSFGNTPLQYQPGYRDPIGRTIEFEIRKVI